MARYTGPRHKLCRRVGEPICGSAKCPALKRPYPPGQHGPRQRQRKMGEYALRLREKQKLRHVYGLTERQFRRYFGRASKARSNTGERLLQLLDTRLDSFVYRAGLARSLRQARQLVTHGHFAVNGRKTDIPSYQLRPEDQVSVRQRSRNLTAIRDAVETSDVGALDYLGVDRERLVARLDRIPERDEIPVNIDEKLIVEYYSR